MRLAAPAEPCLPCLLPPLRVARKCPRTREARRVVDPEPIETEETQGHTLSGKPEERASVTPQLSKTQRALQESGSIGGGRTRAGGAAGDTRLSARGALELIGLVVAPTTLLTALAFYFGWTLINARARYFGIDPSTLGFSTSDYVLRSADALFVPVAVLAATGLAALTIHTAVRSRLSHPRFRRIAVPVAWGVAALGVALLAVGAVGIFETLPNTHYLLAPLSGCELELPPLR